MGQKRKKYKRLASEAMMKWHADAVLNKKEWRKVSWAHQRLRRLNETLLKVMDEVNPCVLIANKPRKRAGRKACKKNTVEEVLQTLEERAQEEEHELAGLGGELAGDWEEKKLDKVWPNRREWLRQFQPSLKRSFMDEKGQLIFEERPVLNYLADCMHEMAAPGDEYLLGEPDQNIQRKVEKRHKRLVALARGPRDMKIRPEDSKRILKFLKRSVCRHQRDYVGGSGGNVVGCAEECYRQCDRVCPDAVLTGPEDER